MRKILSEIKHQLPHFNDDAIIGLRKAEADGLIEFVAERYRECVEVIDKDLKMTGYEILSPVERLNSELRSNPRMNVINIRNDEAVLVKFNFQYHNFKFDRMLYVPYIYEDSTMIIKGTRYECLLGMTEKLFSVRKSNGVTIKVIRSPISFWKNTLHVFRDEATDEQFVGNIISCKIHYKKVSATKKKAKPTAIHYLLCKFTLPEVLVMLGLPGDAASWVQAPIDFTEDNYYFRVQNLAMNKDPVLLKVNKPLMQNDRGLRDLVAAIVYLMSGFKSISYMDLVTDSQTVFKILLGRLIYSSSIGKVSALSYMEKHVESVDTYLDNYTKAIFKANGIPVSDIYELLCFVIKNIDRIIHDHPNNNMFNKRLEAINNVVIESLVASLYYKIYSFERKHDERYMTEVVERSLKVTPRFLLKSLGNSDNVRFSPTIYSDNWLLTIGSKIIKRLSAATKPVTMKGASKKSHGSDINAPVNRYHPSMLIVESAVGFSSSPGTNALINPYVKVDEIGGFVKDDFAREIDNELGSYLPK